MFAVAISPMSDDIPALPAFVPVLVVSVRANANAARTNLDTLRTRRSQGSAISIVDPKSRRLRYFITHFLCLLTANQRADAGSFRRIRAIVSDAEQTNHGSSTKLKSQRQSSRE